MANPVLTGNEIFQVQGLDSAGRPAAVTEQITLTGLTNFENSWVVPTAQSVTSSTTLVPLTANVFNLLAGAQYMFDIYLSVTNGASGGLKVQFGGTTTVTTLSADTWAYSTTTLAAQGVITSLASNLVAYTGTVTTVNITGSIIPATSGTFFLQFAQNVSNGTATTINAGSNFWVDRLA